MSDDLHTISITGRLGRDPELRTVGQSIVCQLNVATNRRAKVGGEWKDETTWYRVSVWSKRGESLAKLLHKGDRIAATGDHEPRQYMGKSGPQTSEEIGNATVYLLGSKSERTDRPRNNNVGLEGDFPDPDGDGEGDAIASAMDDCPF